MQLKLGMLPWQPEAIKLSFADYVNRKAVLVPQRYGHVRNNEVPWQMLGNDAYGDCVLAGAAHETMVWALATGRPLPNYNADTVVQQYLQLSGGQDIGLDPIATAKWRVRTGLTDASGGVHKAHAFASVNRNSDLDTAAYLFGVCGIGFNLPQSAMAEFEAGRPWMDTSGDPVGGHYTPLVGRNSKGNRIVITWGRLQAVGRNFWNRYFLGAVAYVSEEYLLETGKSPEMFDMAQLEANLGALT